MSTKLGAVPCVRTGHLLDGRSRSGFGPAGAFFKHQLLGWRILQVTGRHNTQHRLLRFRILADSVRSSEPIYPPNGDDEIIELDGAITVTTAKRCLIPVHIDDDADVADS